MATQESLRGKKEREKKKKKKRYVKEPGFVRLDPRERVILRGWRCRVDAVYKKIQGHGGCVREGFADSSGSPEIMKG